MSQIEETEKTLVSRGSGKPDYQAESFRVYSFKRFQPKGDEQFRLFSLCWSALPSPYPWVVPPLGAGLNQSLIDTQTGVPMPYTLAAGVELEILLFFMSTDQRLQVALNLDGYHAVEYYNAADQIYFESEIKELRTRDFDPQCLSQHLIQFYGTNLGAANMHGYARILTVLREHSTTRPEVKTIRCRWCEHEEIAPVETTELVCPKCGETTLYTNFPWGGARIEDLDATLHIWPPEARGRDRQPERRDPGARRRDPRYKRRKEK